MGETVLLYSAAAILSACVAALGFKIADESKGGVSITKMVADLAKSSVPGFKVIVGTAAMGLNPGLFYAYMQVVNGRTCVPQNLISWVQNWLSENGSYDSDVPTSPDYKIGDIVLFNGLSFSEVISIMKQSEYASQFDFNQFNRIVAHYNLDLSGKLFQLICNNNRYRGNPLPILTISVYNGPIDNVPGINLSEPQIVAGNASINKYYIPDTDVLQSVTEYSKYAGGDDDFRGGSPSNVETVWYVSTYSYIKETDDSEVIIFSNFGSVVAGKNQTGLESGENVPGKDVVIPGEGTEGITNEDIVGWLQSAVGAAVASALGIGTATIPFVPVAVKNPAITGDITDALDNAIDQAQDIAQAGATDVDTVATGEKYANTSLAPSKPSGNISASSLYTIWNPSQAQLNSLANFLWSTDFVDTIKKILQSPMDALISLALFPVNPPTDGTHNIALGYINSGVSAPRVSDQFMTVQTTGLVVPHKYNSYLDYAPYTKAEIFLPFIGFCPLNINDIMGKSVDVTYNIDLLSGVCTAIVHANAQSLYSYSGNMAMFLPLSAGNWARMLTPIFGMVGGVTSLAAGIGGVMGGAPLLASTGMAVHGAESIGNLDGNSVSRSGGISGNAGIMGDYQPFIIVTRPINDKPSTYNNNIGQTYNKSAQLGTLSGFTVVEEAHIEGLSATETEKNEIERMLKEGVIL